MSDKTEIPAAVISMLEGYAPEEMARIVQWGKEKREAMKHGREQGQRNAKLYADKRHAFIVFAAKQCKTEYPYLTELGVIDNVIARLQEKAQRKESGFRVLKASTIIAHLKRAGFLDSAGFFKREETVLEVSAAAS